MTSICVICPSICGWTVVDLSDFSVATYSVDSSIGVVVATASWTAAGGNCGAWAAGGSERPQAMNIPVSMAAVAARYARITSGLESQCSSVAEIEGLQACRKGRDEGKKGRQRAF